MEATVWRAVLTKENFGKPVNIYDDCVQFVGESFVFRV